MACNCGTGGTKKAYAPDGKAAPAKLFGGKGKKMVVTKNTTKKATRMTFSKNK